MLREQMIANLDLVEQWDLIVIGGGASGLGVALEAQTRGLKTLLLEQYDFAKGTSSRSTKLVHGGLRYLAQGNISLVVEALRERGLMKRNAPHLVHDRLFIIPSYKWWTRPYYAMGLTLYDFMSGNFSLGKSLWCSKAKTLELVPTLRKRNLKGGVVYHDGQFDDSRYAINLCQSFVDNGGVAINYMPVLEILKHKDKAIGLSSTDLETNKTYSLKSKYIVNATGVFVDDILKKDDTTTSNKICVSQGVHLVFDKYVIPNDCALMIPKTSDGRVLFAVPWYNKVIVGTTDVKKDFPEIEPLPLDKEIEFIIDTANRFLEKPVSRCDVKSVFAGLRPLAAPKKNDSKTKEISRGHKILRSKSGIVSVIGGKWTTYRKMGEDVIDFIDKDDVLTISRSISETLHIHAYDDKVDASDPLHFYGSDKASILALRDNEFVSGVLSSKLNILEVQLVWSVREEMVRSVEDFLARRTRALFLDAKESVLIAPRVARILALELNKDEAWEKTQIDKFTFLAQSYILLK